METRVKKVEDSLSELKTEIRLMTHTLESINNTLIEFKAISNTLTDLTIKLANNTKEIESLDTKSKLLFKKYDDTEARLTSVEKSDTLQNAKNGDRERMFWIIITTIGGAFATYLGTRG